MGTSPAIRDLAAAQGGLLTIDQLHAFGVTRGEQRAHVAAERWDPVPFHGIVVRGVDDENRRRRWWQAVVASGSQAALGGVSALHAAGLEGYDEPMIHVWVPKSAWRVRPAGVRLHETRRWGADDRIDTGLPRARPPVAVVQAALWSSSPRQAVLSLVMPLQQRVARPGDVGVELARVRRHRFRKTLVATLADITDGAHSMNELDFAMLCRQYGLPEPTRQAVRHGPHGRIYLDATWDQFRVSVEINGIQHLRADLILKDNFRTIDRQLDGEMVVDLSVLSLRATPDEVMRRIAAVLRRRGWRGAAAAPVRHSA